MRGINSELMLIKSNQSQTLPGMVDSTFAAIKELNWKYAVMFSSKNQQLFLISDIKETDVGDAKYRHSSKHRKRCCLKVLLLYLVISSFQLLSCFLRVCWSPEFAFLLPYFFPLPDAGFTYRRNPLSVCFFVANFSSLVRTVCLSLIKLF